MLQKLIGFMVMLTVLFCFQSQVWAAAVNAETDFQDQQIVLTLEEKESLQALLGPTNLEIFARQGFAGLELQSWFWAFSIFIPGLAQFLANDIIKGVLFFLATGIIGTVAGLVTTVLATLLGPLAAIVGAVVPIVISGIYLEYI